MTDTIQKRAHSDSARRLELDTSLQRPRVMLWSGCQAHGSGYYFYGIRDAPQRAKVFGLSYLKIDSSVSDMRKIRGLCMLCGHAEVFFINADEEEEHCYSTSQLCTKNDCGLPYDHESPPQELRTLYGAEPVPCRQNGDGTPT